KPTLGTFGLLEFAPLIASIFIAAKRPIGQRLVSHTAAYASKEKSSAGKERGDFDRARQDAGINVGEKAFRNRPAPEKSDCQDENHAPNSPGRHHVSPQRRPWWSREPCSCAQVRYIIQRQFEIAAHYFHHHIDIASSPRPV